MVVGIFILALHGGYPSAPTSSIASDFGCAASRAMRFSLTHPLTSSTLNCHAAWQATHFGQDQVALMRGEHDRSSLLRARRGAASNKKPREAREGDQPEQNGEEGELVRIHDLLPAGFIVRGHRRLTFSRRTASSVSSPPPRS